MIHIHKWSKWADVRVEHSSPLFRLPPMVMDGQERRCEKCRKKELRIA